MSAEQEVLEAAERRADALAAGDADALRALLHPAFSWTSHVGRRFDRDQYISANVFGPTRWHGQRLLDAQVTVVGEVAVLRCVVADDVTVADGRMTFRMPVTQTWVRTSAGWQCLAGHAGPSARSETHRRTLLPVEGSVTMRRADVADADGLARLKEEWAGLREPANDEERAEFAGSLRRWMQDHGDTVNCSVAEIDGELVGMAWLVVFERVPNIGDSGRLTGDLQSVFVRPEYRGRGIGGRLVGSLIEHADDLGVPRVTVSANEASVGLYRRLGFAGTPVLLERRAGSVQKGAS